jgi:hypothetical protein
MARPVSILTRNSINVVLALEQRKVDALASGTPSPTRRPRAASA